MQQQGLVVTVSSISTQLEAPGQLPAQLSIDSSTNASTMIAVVAGSLSGVLSLIAVVCLTLFILRRKTAKVDIYGVPSKYMDTRSSTDVSRTDSEVSENDEQWMSGNKTGTEQWMPGNKTGTEQWMPDNKTGTGGSEKRQQSLMLEPPAPVVVVTDRQVSTFDFCVFAYQHAMGKTNAAQMTIRTDNAHTYTYTGAADKV
jgi:hypothetical protein